MITIVRGTRKEKVVVARRMMMAIIDVATGIHHVTVARIMNDQQDVIDHQSISTNTRAIIVGVMNQQPAHRQPLHHQNTDMRTIEVVHIVTMMSMRDIVPGILRPMIIVIP